MFSAAEIQPRRALRDFGMNQDEPARIDFGAGGKRVGETVAGVAKNPVDQRQIAVGRIMEFDPVVDVGIERRVKRTSLILTRDRTYTEMAPALLTPRGHGRVSRYP